jgi:hypothetical protein
MSFFPNYHTHRATSYFDLGETISIGLQAITPRPKPVRYTVEGEVSWGPSNAVASHAEHHRIFISVFNQEKESASTRV